MTSAGIPATDAIEYALRGLDRRTEVIAHNVANAEVPGFTASRLSFESELRNAVARGDVDRAADPSVAATSDPVGVNGNNVQIDVELTEMIKTNLLQQAMVNSFNYKHNVLKTAAGAR